MLVTLGTDSVTHLLLDIREDLRGVLDGPLAHGILLPGVASRFQVGQHALAILVKHGAGQHVVAFEAQLVLHHAGPARDDPHLAEDLGEVYLLLPLLPAFGGIPREDGSQRHQVLDGIGGLHGATRVRERKKRRIGRVTRLDDFPEHRDYLPFLEFGEALLLYGVDLLCLLLRRGRRQRGEALSRFGDGLGDATVSDVSPILFDNMISRLKIACFFKFKNGAAARRGESF